MIEKNAFLTLLLIIFWISVFLYRGWDVFIKRYGHCGKVYYGWTLTVLSLFHFVIGILSISEYLIAVRFYNWIVGLVAFLIFLIGQIMRNQAIKALGIFHSPQIEIKPDHQLVTSTPYSNLRHPYYLGAIFEVGSSPLIFNAYFAFIFYLLTYLPMVLLRIFLEEKVLASHFCNLYEDYRSAVPGFFCFLNKRVQKPKSL